MIHDKLKAIEEKISDSSSMKPENKEAVLELLSELKNEIGEVSDENADQLANLNSLKEIDKPSEDDGLLKSVFNEVEETVQAFEESHPKLVQVVNSICTQLSNSGL
jgi:hypothetical protein